MSRRVTSVVLMSLILLMVNVIPYKKDTGTDTSSPAISTKDDTDDRNSTGAWFDLKGRKLAGTPMQKGVYINNGKKRVNQKSISLHD